MTKSKSISSADSSKEALDALERFVVDNDDLLALESRIGRFNIFDALGISDYEIRHSNFLAFILDPAESHGQGDLFLNAFLMDLLKSSDPALRPFSPIELDGADLRGVEVKREWKNVDLLITCKEPRFAIVVENKVWSREHSNQLQRYAKVVKDNYPAVPQLCVYLTPDGDEPSETHWIPYSYEQIHRALSRVRNAHQDAIGDQVLGFLDHYLSLLGLRFMNDESLDELCRRIYKNHRQALNLIWERVDSPNSAVLAEVASVLADETDLEVYSESGSVSFIPRRWLEGPVPIANEESWPVSVNTWVNNCRLRFAVLVGVLPDGLDRKSIVELLRHECATLGFKRTQSNRVEGTWLRITRAESFLEWGEDDEPETEAVRSRTKKMLNKVHPRLDELGDVIRRLFAEQTFSAE